MRDVKWLSVLFVVLSGLASSPASGQESSQQQVADTTATAALGPASLEGAAVTEIIKALQMGDIQTITRIYQQSQDPVAHLWSAMALERLHFNLAAASADAQICQRTLFDIRPGIALACGRFEAGDLLLAGRGADSMAKERALIEQYKDKRVGHALDNMRAYQAARANEPEMTVAPPATDTVIPTDRDRWSPTFHGSANGKDVKLVLDTGASDLVLGQSEAARLGVRLLGKSGSTSGWLSSNIPTERGRLDELTIDGITWKNLPVSVVPTPISLLGGNLIAPLGTIKVSKGSLTVYGSDSVAPACATPMVAASTLVGGGLRLIPQLQINGAPYSVMLDTGASKYLLGTSGALEQADALHRGKLMMGDIGGTHAFASTRTAKTHMVIGGQPMDIYFEVLTESNIRWPITLGAGALRDMDFLLDFKRQQQCFLVHPGLR